MDHPALAAALRDPSFYPHPVDHVEHIQTHISSVFLTGTLAYKLKKPMNFGFLDFSTPELRRQYCEAEVRLNRRLAPDVYLGVEAITLDGGRPTLAGTGEIVDWVVVMRQLDGELLGPRVLERGELDAALMDKLVDILVPFYEDAATGEGVDRYGTVEAVAFNTDENFAQTEGYVGTALSRRRFDDVKAHTDAFLRDRADLFERRIAEGRVRDGHGDLHLGNIFFTTAPVIFDCIEFNDRFRCGDVAVDLAFLAMDLDFRGRSDLARHFIDGYVRRAGDHELPDLLDFYRCYRAWVRGKVSCFATGDPDIGAAERAEYLDRARRYFQLAHRYAGGNPRPSLVVMFGLMGTGKTSLAAHLADHYGFHLVSSDSVRKRLAGVGEETRVYVPYGAGIYGEEMNRRTYAEMCRQASSLLAGDLAVVLDGSFKERAERRPLIELAQRVGARLLFVQTTCTEDEQRRRLESRQATETRSDGRVELMARQRREFEPPLPDQARLFRTLDTGTRKEETRACLDALLRSEGVL